mgnify:CR=1 FL=1
MDGERYSTYAVRRTCAKLQCGHLTSARLLMLARRDLDVDLEAHRERAQQLYSDAEADERRHRAVRDGGRELDAYSARSVVYIDQRALRHSQLLKRMRMFWVLDAPDEVCAEPTSGD